MCGKSATYNATTYHSHKAWEIVCNISGEGEATFADGKITISERTLLCIPPNFMHQNTSDEGISDIWLWCTDFPMMDDLKITVIDDDTDRSVYAIMNAIHSVQYKNEYENTAAKSAVTEALLDALHQMILSRIPNVTTDARVDEILSIIVSNFHDPSFSVEECLKSNGYCPDYMRRLFKSQTGKSPREYLTDLRIAMAKKMLRARHVSSNTLAQISTAVGFADVCYFARIFKKITGMTPMNYARNFSEHTNQRKK
jgi:AraC-like DNA-binding protein